MLSGSFVVALHMSSFGGCGGHLYISCSRASSSYCALSASLSGSGACDVLCLVDSSSSCVVGVGNELLPSMAPPVQRSGVVFFVIALNSCSKL